MRRSTPALLLSGVLALGGLAACGGDSGSASGDDVGLAAVSISGDVGSAPDVTWKSGTMTTSGTQTKTLVDGTGSEVGQGDSVLVKIWIGNGYDKQKAFSDFDPKTGKAELLTVDSQQGSPTFNKALTGATIGSRVAIATNASTIFGAGGNPQMSIGNRDPLVVVVDLLSAVADGPSGQDQKAPSWAPGLVGGDKPTALSFKGVPKPDGTLKSADLVEGDGATVEKGQSIVVDYLGQVYDGAKPFDENYSKQPTTFQIGTGGVVAGWDKTLVGQKVGSRVLLEIPPKDGYGSAGSPQAGIKGTDTLYFVIDILGAA